MYVLNSKLEFLTNFLGEFGASQIFDVNNQPLKGSFTIYVRADLFSREGERASRFAKTDGRLHFGSVSVPTFCWVEGCGCKKS